jgi:hypothetical protein
MIVRDLFRLAHLALRFVRDGWSRTRTLRFATTLAAAHVVVAAVLISILDRSSVAPGAAEPLERLSWHCRPPSVHQLAVEVRWLAKRHLTPITDAEILARLGDRPDGRELLVAPFIEPLQITVSCG